MKQKGVLVNLELAQAIVNFLETQPFKDVNALLHGLSQCQQMEVDIPEKDEVKGADKL